MTHSWLLLLDPPESRRRILWGALLAILLIGTGTAPAAGPASRPATSPGTQPVDPDLAGWWRGDAADAEGARDLSGQGHPARPVKGKLRIEEQGGRKAFRFTSESGELAVTGDGLDFSSDFSLALWVQLSADIADVTLVSKRSADGACGYSMRHGIRAVGGIGFIAAPRVIVPTPCKAHENWMHACVTFHEGQLILYVDGKAIGFSEMTGLPAPADVPLTIGGGAGDKGALDGWIDDVRVYHRALAESEVTALAAGKEPKSPYPALSKAEEKEIRDLIGQLAADSFSVREKAAARLKDLGRKAFPILRQYRDIDDVELSSRVRVLLGEIAPADAPAPAPRGPGLPLPGAQ